MNNLFDLQDAICTKELVYNLSIAERCSYVLQHCQDETEFVDYFGLFFCNLNGSWTLTIFLVAIALFLQIRMLEAVSDGYVSSAVGKVAGYMKLTEAMAGATLLAFSNGASDVITIVVASGTEETDTLAVGALFGASTFALTCILAAIIWSRPKSVVENLGRGNFVRDILAFMIGVLTFSGLGFMKVSYWIIGVILIGIYFVYVSFVYMEEKNKVSTIGGDSTVESDDSILGNNVSLQDPESSIKESLYDDSIEDSIGDDIGSERKERRRATSIIPEIELLPHDSEKANKEFGKIFYRCKKMIYVGWKKSNIAQKILYVVESPINLAIQLTIPPVDEALYYSYQDLIYPMTTPIFILWSKKSLALEAFGLQAWMIALAAGFLVSLILFFTVKTRDWKARPRWLFLIISIAGGVEWLEFIVTLMIDILQFLQFLTGFSDLFMGMTILGISNSFIDLFINRAMAKQGYEILALTGIFAGQMFNFLFGFGLSSLIKYFKNGNKIKYGLYTFATVFKSKNESLTFGILVANFFTLIFLMGVICVSKKFDIKIAIAGFIWYCIVFAIMMTIELAMN